MPRGRLIPERTVDSLLAYELLTAFPLGLIWSPTNHRGAWDHALFGGGRRVVLFECKAVLANLSATNPTVWKIPIGLSQLHDYVKNRRLSNLLYVLPARPKVASKPWLRDCRSDPDVRGRCLACLNAGAHATRRWAGQEPLVAGAPHRIRLQPWFVHWAWCVPAGDLWCKLGPTKTGDILLSADDADLEVLPGAQRLCHLLHRQGCTGFMSNGGLLDFALDSQQVGGDWPLADDDSAQPLGLLL